MSYKISYQLYSSRNFPPLEKQLPILKSIGYDGEGVHHIAFRVSDTKAAEEALARYGIKTEQQGLHIDASGMYTYLDSAPYLGVTIELLESFPK